MRFSVVIPLYNKAPYVCKALGSVAAQTFRDFDLVVVDDGSIDGSGDVASSFLATTELSYQFIRQDNAGVSIARNRGVAASHGDFICFLDADDWWEPSFLERMDALIGNYPEAGIYGTNYFYVKNGQRRIGIKDVETGIMNYCQVYAQSLAMPLCTGSIAVSRLAFDALGGFNPKLKLGEDFDLWIRIAIRKDVAFLNEPLFNYNQDVDIAWRGTRHLVNPSHHMLWNLDYLSEEERTNPDYKRLIDSLRTYNLLSYYLSRPFRDIAKKELNKVDWSRQPKKVCRLYSLPIWFLKMRRSFLRAGSKIKQWLIKHI